MQECFQAYIRQRTSTTNPDEHRADRLDNVEAGNGDDDRTDKNELRDFVTPSAGVGPIAMSVADQVSMRSNLSERWWYVQANTLDLGGR